MYAYSYIPYCILYTLLHTYTCIMATFYIHITLYQVLVCTTNTGPDQAIERVITYHPFKAGNSKFSIVTIKNVSHYANNADNCEPLNCSGC